MMRRTFLGVVLACLTHFSMCEAAKGLSSIGVDLDSWPSAVEGIADLEDKLFQDGRVLIGAQPSEESLAELAKRGVGVVVSMRTPKEMNDRERVPFDEASVVGELGMSYEAIPLGGNDHPYTPEAVDRLEEILLDSEVPIFLHCTLGGRAAYVWLAYLVSRHGVSLEEAIDRGEAMMLKPHPVGRLLGRETTLVLVEE